ncbi:TPA: hypothetical protein MIX26_20795 [Klebsiella pneumoniae]|nr:hypothetical protein [Klebsiella pneumoniae]
MSCKYMHDAALLEFHSLISLHKAIDGLIVVYNGYGNKYEDEYKISGGCPDFLCLQRAVYRCAG